MSRANSGSHPEPQITLMMPIGAPEAPFKLLNDFPAAAHRAIQALQIAVDHQDQVIEPLSAGHVDGAQHLGLVAFSVAEETPDLATVRGLEAPVL